jgi:hypothetical protein
MPLRATALPFPVLCLSRGHNVLHYARHADELLVCSAKALRSGFYHHMEIVDAHAQRYRVQGALKTDNVGPFWGFNLLGGQTIRVALELELLPNQSVEVLKEQVLQAMNDSELYDADPEAKRLVQAAVNWSELLAQLAHDFYQVH